MVPFVYLASVCRSLQSVISALTQAGGGGLLFRFACSVVLRGGRGATDKCHWRLRRALAVFPPHWVCPAHGIVLPPSTLLRLQAALQGAGPELRALPRPKPLRFRFSGTPQRRRLSWACVLCPSLAEQLRKPDSWQAHSLQAASASYHLPVPVGRIPGLQQAHPSPVCRFSLPGR